jgi:16S rRNA (cytosine1402-N4)-methyltransferase
MVDCTLGEGGHSAVFLTRFPGLRVTGIDADGEIIKAAAERLKEFGGRIEFYHGWAQDFLRRLGAAGQNRSAVLPLSGMPQAHLTRGTRTFGDLGPPGIILLDLGVSLYHYEKGDRGFSFRGTENLDMRIDTCSGPSAAEIIRSYSESDLADMFFFNAGERYSRRIAGAVVQARRRAAITSSAALERIVWDAVPSAYRRRRIHPATKVFQALRVEVNGELKKLPDLLETAFFALRPGGRLGVITFNSLEDRIVKNFFRGKAGGFHGTPDMPIVKKARLLTAKPVSPSREELASNPPSRSAKLRAILKC